jgi:hypothetical protein
MGANAAKEWKARGTGGRSHPCAVATSGAVANAVIA